MKFLYKNAWVFFSLGSRIEKQNSFPHPREAGFHPPQVVSSAAGGFQRKSPCVSKGFSMG
jgi:hypothetical protein